MGKYQFTIKCTILVKLANSIIIFEGLIETQLIPNPQTYKHSDSHTQSQTKDIDKAIQLVFEDVSPGDFKVVGEHGLDVRL